MIRTIIGFILGAVATFYTLPFIESGTGKLPRPAIGDWFSSENNNHSSNIINSVPPSDYRQHADSKLAAEVMTALSFTLPGMPLIYSGQEYDMQKRLRFFEKDTIPHQQNKFWPIRITVVAKKSF